MTENDYKGKLLRLCREIMLLNRSPIGLSINELAKKLGVSYRTVYRDFEVLQEVGFFPEEVSKSKYVIRGLDNDVRKFEKNLQFNAEEAGILSQAVSSIAEKNPMKKQLLEKLLSFSGMEDVLKVIVKQEISRNIEMLARAVREKRVVTLRNYHSSHSQSIKIRRVEPYAFSRDGAFVKCFELDSNTNKTFKIERIEEVLLADTPWQNEALHETETHEDIFGLTGGKNHKIELRMTLRAANLLQEEFPLSRPFVFKEDYSNYLFEANVNSFIGVSRFILGLIDEIEVIAPTELKTFLLEKIASRKF